MCFSRRSEMRYEFHWVKRVEDYMLVILAEMETLSEEDNL